MKEKKFEQYKRIFRFFEMAMTLAVQCGMFAYAWYMHINVLAPKPFSGKGNLLEIAVYILVTFIFVRNVILFDLIALIRDSYVTDDRIPNAVFGPIPLTLISIIKTDFSSNELNPTRYDSPSLTT